MNSVLEKGKKWSEIAAVLKRTEHTVKNRFNSLMIKSQRDCPSESRENRLISSVIQQLQQEGRSEGIVEVAESGM